MAAEPSLLLDLPRWSLTRRTPTADIPILDGVHLRIRQGRWLAVLGANGSGKSSLLKHLAADESPLDVTSAVMFQDPEDQIVAATVGRELALGRPGLPVGRLLAELGLQEHQDLDPRRLSAGQKQRLVLAVALAGDPQVLLADEPTALQDPQQAGWVLDRLQGWLAEKPGRTLITATCDHRELARADDLLLLGEAGIRLEGPVSDLRQHPLVLEVLGPAGHDAAAASRPAAPTPGQEAVQVRGLRLRFGGGARGLALETLDVGRGERLGLCGSNGCGKSTLLAALAGARKPEEGSVRLDRYLLYRGGVLDLEHGLAMLAPQFPEYLFTRESVAGELAVDPVLAGRPAGDLLTAWGLPAEVAERNPHSLSTGQRRRLALGLVLGSERPVLLLDEPTAALDHQGRAAVLRALTQLPPATALVMASHDRTFLHEAGCRILDLDTLATDF